MYWKLWYVRLDLRTERFMHELYACFDAALACGSSATHENRPNKDCEGGMNRVLSSLPHTHDDLYASASALVNDHDQKNTQYPSCTTRPS